MGEVVQGRVVLLFDVLRLIKLSSANAEEWRYDKTQEREIQADCTVLDGAT